MIKPVLLFLSLSGLFCLPSWASADSRLTALERVLVEVENKGFAKSASWLRLGLYERDSSSESGWKSAVHSKSFFLAEQGSTNPVDELNASIRAFSEPVGDVPDLHAQCLFKGRYAWLLSRLEAESDAFPSVQCASFGKWTKDFAVDSISLLYATGYLGNPASFYGHTLLKFNSASASRSSLLDVSVNYGAIVPPNEGPIMYVLKGVFGGYDAGFSHIQYYFHTHNYGELELRDIWEYELSLTQPQVDLIMGHLWELLGKKYRYYFFRKNCAYRMAEILELIDGLEIIPRKHPYVYPQTIVTNLNQATLNGQSVVSAVKYYPSRQSRLYHKYEQLNTIEKKVMKDAALDIAVLASGEYQNMDVASKQATLETLGDYFQFSSDINKASKEVKSNYKQVLSERFKLPAGNVFTSIKGAEPPHKGRRPSFVQVSAVSNRALNEGLAVNIRPSYYDALDAGSGHVENSELKMAEVKLTYLDSKLSLRKLDIVSVQSVSSARTGLPGDNGRTWRLKLGLEQQNLLCDSCLVGRFQGDIGLAKHFSSTVVAGVNVGGAVQNNRNGYGALYAKSSAFTNVRLTDKTNFRLEFENRHHLDSDQGDEAVYFFEGRHSLSRNMDIRVLFESNKAKEYSLSLGYYW